MSQGTIEVELERFKGEKGERGERGATPQKGVDYMTPEEIAQERAYTDERIYAAHGRFASRGVEQYSGGVLTMFDDDGTTRFVSEHVPVYKAHGVRATAAIIPLRASTGTGLTTNGDPYECFDAHTCRALIRDGFEIASHTWSHDRAVFNESYNAQATPEDADREFGMADEWFRAEGIDTVCIAYPWGCKKYTNVAKRYARFAVSTEGGFNRPYQDPMTFLRCAALDGESNVGSLKNWIKIAHENHFWLIIMTHAGMNQPSAQGLDQVLTYAQEIGMRIEPFNRAVKLKGPACYAGNGETALYVAADGKTQARLTDESIRALLLRAEEMGLVTVNRKIVIVTQPRDVSVKAGAISQSLMIGATTAEGTLAYQWFTCEADGTGAVAIEGATASTYALPSDLTVGAHHYRCTVYAQGITMDSDVATVTVSEETAVYYARYEMAGTPGASVKTTVTDGVADSGNGDMTISGVSKYGASGYPVFSASGQMAAIPSFAALPNAYKIHMRLSKTAAQQHRIFSLPAIDLHFLFNGNGVYELGNLPNIQVESGSAIEGFTSPTYFLGIGTVSTTAGGGAAINQLADAAFDIQVNGNQLTCTLTGMNTDGVTAYDSTDTITITGFTQALCTGGIVLGNRADGARPLGGAFKEFWIESV